MQGHRVIEVTVHFEFIFYFLILEGDQDFDFIHRFGELVISKQLNNNQDLYASFKVELDGSNPQDISER